MSQRTKKVQQSRRVAKLLTYGRHIANRSDE